jgi:hypothetical protein
MLTSSVDEGRVMLVDWDELLGLRDSSLEFDSLMVAGGCICDELSSVFCD